MKQTLDPKPDFARLHRQAFPAPAGKAWLKSSVRSLALSALGVLRRPRAGDSLRLLYCHHVFDDERSQFAAAMDYLTSVGRFVDTAEVLRIARGEQPLEGSLFHLSFDDGYKNIVDNAAPALSERGIPSLFFVPTSLVGGVDAGPSERSLPIELADWSDLERAAKLGMQIGSHTRTHARFSEISQSQSRLEDEIFGSKQDIERRLGVCDYISWPYGRASDADDQALAAVAQAGYLACFGAFRGRVEPGQTDLLRIPRHHFEAYWPLSHLRYFALGGREEG